MERNNRTLYSYFGEDRHIDRDIIDTAYQLVKNDALKANFKKRWGPYLNGTNNSYKEYTEKDKQDFFVYEKIFEDKINYVLSMTKIGKTLREIKESAKDKTAKGEITDLYDIEQSKQNKSDNGDVKTSFFNYFPVDQEEEVRKQLSIEKRSGSPFYYVIVDQYGSNYDCLNRNYILMGDEKLAKNSGIKKINRELKKKKNNKVMELSNPEMKVTNKRTINVETSYFDYFNPSDKEKVFIILEGYRKMGHKNHATIKKWYGENYDQLNTEIEFTKEDKRAKSTATIAIRKILRKYSILELKEYPLEELIKMSRNLGATKLSYFEYFKPEDKEKVTIILGLYEKAEHKCHAIIKKWYGENYDNLNKKIEYTQEERSAKTAMTKTIRKMLEKFNVVELKSHTLDELFEMLHNSRSLRPSFFCYFGADEKDEVIAILEQYKKDNNKYYLTVVKIYGENYDKLNTEIEITKE